MKRLTLLRHAKTQDESISGDDFDRSLATRGLRDIAAMAKRWTKHHPVPDLIVASPAVRAAMTARGFAAGIGYPQSSLCFEMGLYLAMPDVLLSHAKAAAETHGARHVLLVSHNPGLAVLGQMLGGDAISSMPTCSWVDIDLAGPKPELLGFERPSR